jgi:hypothetical protein
VIPITRTGLRECETSTCRHPCDTTFPAFESLEITSRITCAPLPPPVTPSAPPRIGRARLRARPSVNRGWHAVAVRLFHRPKWEGV